MRKAYSTDLSDAEWSYLKAYLPAPKARGRPRVHNTREILNAIFFYVLRGGCPWRLLPHDFPPWTTVYHYFRKNGVWRAPGSGCTRPSENVFAYALSAILNQALG